MQNTNTTDEIVEINLQELMGLLIHWLWLILLSGIGTGVIGFAISSFVITPQYQSGTSVYIINRQNENTLTYSDVQLNSQLTKDYAQLIKSRTVLEKVISNCTLELSYEELLKRVDVETITETRIINIKVTDDDPVMAQLLANEIRKEAADRIKNVMDIEAVNAVDEANLPKAPYTPSVKKWTGFGFLLGIFLCAMILIIRYLLDDSIKTSDDVERYLGLSTLATIPVLEEPEKKKHGKRHRHVETEMESEAAVEAAEKVADSLSEQTQEELVDLELAAEEPKRRDGQKEKEAL